MVNYGVFIMRWKRGDGRKSTKGKGGEVTSALGQKCDGGEKSLAVR